MTSGLKNSAATENSHGWSEHALFELLRSYAYFCFGRAECYTRRRSRQKRARTAF